MKALMDALGIRYTGDPVFALRQHVEGLRAENARIQDNHAAALKIVEGMGERCPFGERCYKCKPHPYNCGPRLREALTRGIE